MLLSEFLAEIRNQVQVQVRREDIAEAFGAPEGDRVNWNIGQTRLTLEPVAPNPTGTYVLVVARTPPAVDPSDAASTAIPIRLDAEHIDVVLEALRKASFES